MPYIEGRLLLLQEAALHASWNLAVGRPQPSWQNQRFDASQRSSLLSIFLCILSSSPANPRAASITCTVWMVSPEVGKAGKTRSGAYSGYLGVVT